MITLQWSIWIMAGNHLDCLLRKHDLLEGGANCSKGSCEAMQIVRRAVMYLECLVMQVRNHNLVTCPIREAVLPILRRNDLGGHSADIVVGMSGLGEIPPYLGAIPNLH
jgi:hypothetical protein